MTVVVVGATGVLRPAVETLVARAVPVVCVGRSALRLAELCDLLGELCEPVTADTLETSPALPARVQGVVAYGPAVAAAVVDDLRAASDGPVVLVLTSAVAAPGPEHWTIADLPPAPGVRRLVLGWTEWGAWHDPAVISAAAIDLLDAPADEDRLLGSVRPWSGRPS